MTKVLKKKNAQLLLGLALLVAALGASYFLTVSNEPFRSVELGVAEHSPLGSSGGVVVPASCPSYDHGTGGECAGCPLGYFYNASDQCVYSGCPSGYTLNGDVCDPITQPPPPPVTPTLAQPVMYPVHCSDSGTRVVFDWAGVSGANEYPVRYSGPAPTTSNNCPAGWFSAVSGECALDNQNVTSISSGAITPGTIYTWWVHAKYAGTWNGASAYTQVAFKCFAPPVMNAVQCNTNGTATLSWGSVAGGPTYAPRFYSAGLASCPSGWFNPVAGECANDAVSGNSVTIPVVAGNPYYWWVHAKDPSTWQGASTLTQVAFTCNNPTLAQPVMNAPSCNAAGTQVTLTWGAVAGATAYMPRVDNLATNCGSYPSYVSGAANTGCTSGQEYTGGNPGSDTTRTVTLNIQPNTSYRWWVHAGYANSWSGLSPSTNVDFSCPSAPSTGSILVRRVGSDLTVATVPAGTQAATSYAPSSWLATNPSLFSSIPAASRDVYVTDVAGYAETGGTCQYIEGGTECSVSTFNLTPTCNGSSCTFTSLPMTAGYTTKIAVRYLVSTPTPTCTISASPSSVTSGQSSVLTKSSTNTTSATLNGVSTATSGTQTVNPTVTTTYTMNVTGPGGTGSCATTVIVSATPPPTAPTSMAATCGAGGTSATLSWPAVSGATYYNPRFAKPSIGSCPSGWTLLGDGATCYMDGYTGTSVVVPILANTTYDAWVQSGNSSGVSSGATHVPGNAFSCAGDTIPTAPTNAVGSCNAAGTLATFTWSPVAGATNYWFRTYGVSQAECQAKAGWQWLSASGVNYCYPNPDSAPNVTSVTFPTVPGTAYSWLVAASNSAGVGPSTYGFVSCPIPSPTTPTCTITADHPSYYSTGTIILTKTSSNATSATLNGVATATSGTTTVNPNANTTYTMVVSGPGGTGSCSTSVTIPPPPTNFIGTCNAAGNQVTLSWTPPAGFTHFFLRGETPTGTGAGPFIYPPTSEDFVGTSTVVPVVPGQSYDFWIHTRSTDGYWSDAPQVWNKVCTPAAPTTGEVMVKRVGSDLTTNTVPPGTYTALDSNASTWYATNPQIFTSVVAGAHTVFVTDIAGYTETVGTCSYATGGTECAVSTFPTTPTCASAQCWVASSVTAGQTTKVAVLYTVTAPTTGSILIKRVGSDLTTATAPASNAYVDSGTPSATNPLTVSSLTVATHTSSFTDVAGYTETVGTCSYATGGTECAVSTFPTTPTCASGICSVSTAVTSGQTTKVAVLYTVTSASGVSCSVSSITAGGSMSGTVSMGISTNDWLAVFNATDVTSASTYTTSGAQFPGNAYQPYQYVPLPRPQTVNFIAPTVAGNYQLRLQDNNAFTTIGSCSFSVTSGCVPASPSTQTQTVACPAGQTGSITQQRTSTCPGPTWSAWTNTGSTCTSTSGEVMIKRVDLALNPLTQTTNAYIDNASGSTATNPSVFTSVTPGGHTAYSTDLAGYTETVGTCTYPIGGTECTVASYPTTPTCSAGFCSVPITVTAGQTTKVVPRYSATTGEIMIKRVDGSLNPISGTSGIVDGSSNTTNPATFLSLSTSGTHTVGFTDLAGFVESVGTCTFATGGTECTVATYPTAPTCSAGTCSIPAVSVTAGQTYKVAVRYFVATTPTINLYVPTPGTTRVTAGDTVTIAWDITGATGWSCSVSGPGLSQTVTTGGSTAQVINSQSLYTLTCTPPGGSGLSPQTSTLLINLIPSGTEA